MKRILLCVIAMLTNCILSLWLKGLSIPYEGVVSWFMESAFPIRRDNLMSLNWSDEWPV